MRAERALARTSRGEEGKVRFEKQPGAPPAAPRTRGEGRAPSAP